MGSKASRLRMRVSDQRGRMNAGSMLRGHVPPNLRPLRLPSSRAPVPPNLWKMPSFLVSWIRGGNEKRSWNEGPRRRVFLGESWKRGPGKAETKGRFWRRSFPESGGVWRPMGKCAHACGAEISEMNRSFPIFQQREAEEQRGLAACAMQMARRRARLGRSSATCGSSAAG
jgi:hypothetical protein